MGRINDILRRILTGSFIAAAVASAYSQELDCRFDVNTSSVEGTYRSIFEDLQRDVSAYLNETKWTDTNFSPVERIDCRMLLNVTDYSGGRIKGDLQVQLSRPVYNSTYTSMLFNFKDEKIEFDYKEGERLVRNDNGWNGNLTGLLDFYAYLLLAIDFDSFSPRGGQQWLDRASAVVSMAQSSGEPGWRAFEDNRNRSAVLGAFTEPSTAPMRDLIYAYHRKGLDEMATSPDKGRHAITEALATLSGVYSAAPMSVALPIFRDAKLDELVNVYSKAPEDERQRAYEILSAVYPADEDRLERIRQPE